MQIMTRNGATQLSIGGSSGVTTGPGLGRPGPGFGPGGDGPGGGGGGGGGFC